MDTTQSNGPVPDLLTTEQLAARWGYETATLVTWRATNKGPKYVKLGGTGRGHVMYRIADVLEYEKQMSVEPSDGAK